MGLNHDNAMFTFCNHDNFNHADSQHDHRCIVFMGHSHDDDVL